MSADDYTDDYVANLLRQDAKATSSAASNRGLGSLLNHNNRRTESAPKPNTRFLKNLIRDTDSHNAALLAKEAEESRARLKRLREDKDRERQKGRPDRVFYSARARHDGRASASQQQQRPPPSKRRRLSHDDKEEEREKDKVRSGHESRGHESHRHERRRDEHHKHSTRRSRRRRSRSPDRSRSRERETKDKDDIKTQKHHHRHSRRRSTSPDDRERRRRRDRRSTSEDSDPLEAILGPAPAPPVRSRGRGALNPSTIDAHFSSTYDPSADVSLDSATTMSFSKSRNDNDDDLGDDWDGALEALRDRQKWRQQGADRLRSAGFSEDEIRKWASRKIDAATGERVLDEADVKWNKRGEGREWDRGKVVDDEDGSVSVKPEWGRLKGT